MNTKSLVNDFFMWGNKVMTAPKLIDLDQLFERYSEEMDVLETCVDLMISSLTKYWISIEEGYISGSCEDLHVAAHTFKGAVANFGAETLGSKLEDIEETTASNEFPATALCDLKVIVNQFEKELSQLQETLTGKNNVRS